MATFDEYRKSLKAVIKDLNANRRKNTFVIARDAFALVADRVTETGEKATGGKFASYSPAYRKAKSEGTAKAGVGARTVTFRDFKLTNKMWAAIRPLFDGENKTSVSYVHGTRDPIQLAKLDANIARSGDFLALSKSEIEILDATNQERLLKAFKDNGIL
jgi:hypothetical protein